MTTAAQQRPPKVFVSVGTDHHPFDRLVKWVDDWLESLPPGAVDVFIQSGTSSTPRSARSKAYVASEEMESLLREAAAVVCHGGPGTIQEARRAGFVPIVVPRESARGEHVDDHQVHFTKRAADAGEAHVVRTEQALRELLDQALQDTERFRAAPPGGGDVDLAVQRFRVAVNDLFAQPPDPDVRVPVLFIAGLGRSGTTLLDRMMGQLEGFESVGELVHMWLRGVAENDLCGCGKPFLDCAFWSEIGREIAGGWNGLDAAAVLQLQEAVDRHRFVPLMLAPDLWPPYRRRLTQFGNLLGRLYRALQSRSGARVIVDSSKYVSYAYLLRHVPNIDVRVVHIVRDSRGVAYSWTKEVRRPEVVSEDAFMPTYHPGRMAARWSSYNLAYDMLPRFGVKTMTLRYESLVAHPREEISRILRFAGEDPDTYDLGFIGNQTIHVEPNHSCSGNPMRFKTGDVPLVHDEEWRRRLSDKDRATVTWLTKPLMKKYGYELEREGK